jgi:GTP cyclohydrolase I
VASVDRERIEAAVGEILAAIGEDPRRDGLKDTPRRVAELFGELYGAVGDDPAAALGASFAAPTAEESAMSAAAASSSLPSSTSAASDQPVLMRDITFRSVCEHHLLPFEGVVHVAYVPADRLAGLGSIVALVESASSRPQLQERLTDDIADAIERGLEARGVLVVMDARHGCVSARGPRQTRSTTVTLAARGVLAEPSARAEVTALIAAPRGDAR